MTPRRLYLSFVRDFPLLKKDVVVTTLAAVKTVPYTPLRIHGKFEHLEGADSIHHGSTSWLNLTLVVAS